MGVFPMKMCLRTLISVKDHGFAEKFEVIKCDRKILNRELERSDYLLLCITICLYYNSLQ